MLMIRPFDPYYPDLIQDLYVTYETVKFQPVPVDDHHQIWAHFGDEQLVVFTTDSEDKVRGLLDVITRLMVVQGIAAFDFRALAYSTGPDGKDFMPDDAPGQEEKGGLVYLQGHGPEAEESDEDIPQTR